MIVPFFNRKKEIYSKDNGVLILVFGNSIQTLNEGEDDSNIFSQFSQNLKLISVQDVDELTDAIAVHSPELLHLIAKFDCNGKVNDAKGNVLGLGEIMKLAEVSGVRLFFSASENNFEYLKNEIINSKVMDFMTILQRNRHYPAFLKGLISEMANTRSFSLAYVNLAPQHEMAQKGLPLPGSIAVCPSKHGKSIILWTNAQE